MNGNDAYPLVPESWKRPWMILWTAILPQALLLWMNIQSWHLVSGEMADDQLQWAFFVFAGEVGLLAANAGLFVFLLARRRLFNGWIGASSLVLHAGFLFLVCYALGEGLLPSSVTTWILPEEVFVYYQFALIMPAAFFGLACMACYPRRPRNHRDLALTLSLCIGIPLGWFGLVSIRWPHFPSWMDWMGPVVFALFTFVLIAALVRLVFIICAGVRSQNRAVQMIFAGLFGLILPLGGLTVNWFVPLPADFQFLAIYALAILNGVFLLLPDDGAERSRLIVWLGRCLLYPFTFYFFIVFLPFLPFSIPAMIIMGAGFLILTPTVLFLFHTRLIAEGFSHAATTLSRAKIMGLMVGALSLIPAYILGGAVMDRINLHEALRYAYQDQPSDTAPYRGSRLLLKHSLHRLRDFKAGRHLPFLSSLYNKIVFDGLVLPDDKMQDLHRTFFGCDLEEPRSQGKYAAYFSSRPRAFSIRPPMRPVPTQAVLESVRTSEFEEDGCRSMLAQLEIRNPLDQQEEFVTQISLPDGVMISGFWLHIGKDRVPGRIFEKKTALWVYRMIRDMTRRDPGLLYYQDKNHLELRVFPLAAKETRQVEIEFLYPGTLSPAIAMGDRRFSPKGGQGISLVASESTGTYAVVSSETLAALPKATRRPYLHFIIDRSLSGAVDSTSVVARCRSLAAQFPEIADCAVTYANYEVCDASDALIPVESLEQVLSGELLPVRGGFCRDRAIRHALAVYAGRLQPADAAAPFFLRYPVVVVVSTDESRPLAQGNLKAFMAHSPDVPCFYTAAKENELKAEGLDGKQEDAACLRTRPVNVVLFELGGEIVACPADGGRSAALTFLRGEGSVLRVYDPARGDFQPLEKATWLSSKSRYGQGSEALLIHAAAERDASRAFELQPLLAEKSRQCGILTPATSYIVVENSAQWKMLELTEKKKLKNFEALELAATPEPSTWGLMLLAGGCLAWRAWRQGRRPSP
ncbi:MAG TPA: MSEP-CTERM sorting domain-containing protein [Verrucomicrobia bacterium]|nr:MAG: MSEP-CTERM sorting domain-containing protein [Lentisphaerae bacterium GWF2_57_35]HBA85786.1 MSEP-CTERM sorting domain-containing protein [Verrucomicrobiota bacterium]